MSDGTRSLSSLAAVRWVDLPTSADARGVLTAAEVGLEVPFEVRRVLLLHQLRAERGGHAHRDAEQLLVAAAGSFEVELFDPQRSATWTLDSPDRALFVPRMLFFVLRDFSPGAVCLVLGSQLHDPARTIRSRGEFLRAVGPGAE